MGKQKNFLILIPSYNNQDIVKRNLNSVFFQSYNQFDIVYVDDASTDRTQDVVKDMLKKNRGTLIANQCRLGAMENIYQIVSQVPKDTIVVLVDGDDWLAHEGVLERLNEVYSSEDVWLTYGQYMNYPSYKKGLILPANIPTLRQDQWALSHLKTFYAGLFHKIDKKDLQIEGSFVQVASDVAFMTPMVEMAGERTRQIDEILYVYNCENPLSDERLVGEKQLEVTNIIRNRQPYLPLERF